MVTTAQARINTPTRVIALLVISLSIRPVLASLPPLSLDIQASLGFSDALIGSLTTIPIVCMAVFALLIPRLVRLGGLAWLTVVGLVAISASLLLRLAGETWPESLFISALLAGCGIAICAGVTPSFVRSWFPERTMVVSSQTTATFMGGAAVAAAVSVPLAQWWGSWTLALAVWAIPALLATALWVVIAPRVHVPRSLEAPRMILPWRSRTAWLLSALLAVNSIAFYLLLAWMAPAYDERGWTQVEGGYLFGFLTIVQVVGALVIPRITVRQADRRPLFVVVVLISTAALVVMGFAPSWLSWVVIAIAGVGLGGAFAVGMGLLPELSRDAHDAAGLTAMAMFIAYGAAALGPFAAGLVLDAGAGWEVVFSIAAVFCLAQLIGLSPLQRATGGPDN